VSGLSAAGQLYWPRDKVILIEGTLTSDFIIECDSLESIRRFPSNPGFCLLLGGIFLHIAEGQTVGTAHAFRRTNE
jgi:hypothetical protein